LNINGFMLILVRKNRKTPIAPLGHCIPQSQIQFRMTPCKLAIFVVSECKHQLVCNLYMAMRVMTKMSKKADLGILSDPEAFLGRSSGESIAREAQSNNMERGMIGRRLQQQW